MSSLRQRVTTYFRQLSFITEPREDIRLTSGLSPRNIRGDDGCFITKYLEGRITKTNSTEVEISCGKEPNDLPDLYLDNYCTGPDKITAACTGPDEGLCGVKRSRLHLSAGPDIDFIDTIQEPDIDIRRSLSLTTTSTKSSIKSNSKLRNSDPSATKLGVRSRKNSKVINDTVTKLDSITHSNSHSINNNNSLIEKSKIIEKGTINVIVSMISTMPAQTTENSIISMTTNTTKHLLNDLNSNKINNDNNNSSYASILIGNINDKKSTVMNNNSNNNNNNNEEMESPDLIAGVPNWKLENDYAYGLSVSLYEKNFITNEQAGNPIADCYGIVARENSCAMALADGVNWGEGARLAARSAVQGSLEYLDTAVFGTVTGCMATSTREVFISLLRSFWEAHACILEVGGAFTTLTVAVILPLINDDKYNGKYIVCSCNVGDSLGYVYSKHYGVREFTQGSHDTTSMRDMRDALGALGPVNGNKPELRNLTLSMTIVEFGDIVFLTSDGISDNFDPVVGKFAEPFSLESQVQQQHNNNNNELRTSQLAPKRQNRSTSSVITTPSINNNITANTNRNSLQTANQQILKQKSSNVTFNSVQPTKPPRNKKNARISAPPLSTLSSTAIAPSPSSSSSSSNKISTLNNNTNVTTTGATTVTTTRLKFLRSHTIIAPRISFTKSPIIKYPKSAAGLPLVTGKQRHTLTLLRLEDLFSYGINGTLRPCSSARKLCHLLIDFVKMITSARRKILEPKELYYKTLTDHNGVKREIELNKVQQRDARKRVVDGTLFSSLPGKLDHASVVAFMVGGGTVIQNNNNNNNSAEIEIDNGHFSATNF